MNKNRRRLLAFIVKYVDHHGFGPTVEEMREAMKFVSNSSVAFHVKVLGREKFVDISPRKHRNVVPTAKGIKALNLR